MEDVSLLSCFVLPAFLFFYFILFHYYYYFFFFSSPTVNMLNVGLFCCRMHQRTNNSCSVLFVFAFFFFG